MEFETDPQAHGYRILLGSLEHDTSLSDEWVEDSNQTGRATETRASNRNISGITKQLPRVKPRRFSNVD